MKTSFVATMGLNGLLNAEEDEEKLTILILRNYKN